jgi:macrodomain Ter protein organizer (MatP/YcbG family)
MAKLAEPGEWMTERRARQVANYEALSRFLDEGGKADPVTHPPHYTSHPSGVECLTITRHMNFNLGNAMKYIWRADLKRDAIEDLRKAAFYIADEIKRREGDG